MVSIIISMRSVPGDRPWRRSSLSRRRTSVRGCSGMVTFGSVTTKFSGKRPAVAASSVPTKISSVRAPRAFHSSPNDLIRMPRNGGSDPFRQAARHLRGGGSGSRVLVGVGARAEAVLEVDAEVLDGLAAKLGQHALVDRKGKPGVRVLAAQGAWIAPEDRAQRGQLGPLEFGRREEAHAPRELRWIASEGLHAAQGQLPKALRGVGAVQVRAAIDRVHGLARVGLARVRAAEGAVRVS